MATPQPKPASPSGGAGGPPKADSVRILVGADEDVISDWKKLKLTAVVPMNMPIKPYLERLVTTRLKWESALEGVRVVTTSGDKLSDVAPTGNLFQINLSPKQLGFKADSYQFAWMQHASENDEALLTPAESTKQRLMRYFQYYAPEKGEKDALALMEDFDGNHDLMFVQLVGKYGQEPTQEMLYRKRIAPARSAKAGRRAGDTGATAAATDDRRLAGTSGAAASPGGGGGGGGVPPQEFGDLSGIAVLMSRTSTALLHTAYFKKWFSWMRSRRESKRIVSFMTGNVDSFLRNQSYNRWKRFAELNKTRRQLAVSTKLAFKQESVVGGLAEENAVLKQDMRKLKAQVEVLESNNSRRLESLFSSSESAIIQMKLLTSELHDKERTIASLEQRLLAMGNKMLAQGEDRDRALERAASAEEERDASVRHLQERIGDLEADNIVLRDQMDKLRPKTPPDVCKHCPHYSMVLNEADAVRAHAKGLLERLDASESERRSLNDQLQQLRQAARDSASPNRGSPRGASSNRTSGGRQPSPPPPGHSQPQSDGGDAGGNTESTRQLQQPPPNSSMAGAFDGFDSGGASTMRNVSFALPPPPGGGGGASAPNTSMGDVPNTSVARNQSMYSVPGSAYTNASFAGSTANLGGSSLSDMPMQTPPHPPLRPDDMRQQSTFVAEEPTSLPPRVTRQVDLSMSSFFGNEDRIGTERVRMSMERQAASRYGPGSVARNRGAPPMATSTGSAAGQGIGRYKVAQPDGRRDPMDAARPSLATSAPIPGMPGTAPIGSDSQQSIVALNRAMEEPASVRPRANPIHRQFETGPTAGPAAMRSQLFSFPRSSSAASGGHY